ncbi:MAG TPA: crossover junction endodeoxyribonuclease RuvC [Candidatus Dormibacteraeota bacterium]|jgi:crossover junction endodeoxyribonuclease RuvC
MPATARLGPAGLLLGVDPGLAATGWALLDGGSRVAGCGTIRTSPGPAAPRLLEIVTQIKRVLESETIGEAALEELFMGRNSTSALGVAQARGAVLTALAEAGIAIFEYKPAQVKAALTGYGMAGKTQMARMLALQVELTVRVDEHAADAIAIALCHARGRRLRTMTRA